MTMLGKIQNHYI